MVKLRERIVYLRERGRAMKTVSDHLGRILTYTNPPQRIVSLCPAITETLFHLQLENEIVGRTRFCIHPKEQVRHVVNVGGTKEIKLDRIHSLQPDLIIAEKEENTKEIVASLEQDYPVFVFEIQTINDALRMIIDVGKLTDRSKQALQMIKEIESQWTRLPNVKQKRAAYVIWKNPYMVVGQHTYIQELLNKLGFINPFTNHQGRYPVVTKAELQEASLDYLLLATEPFPFREKHKEAFLTILPNTKPIIIDGEMFWYGAKMIEAAAYFRKKLAHL